MVTTHETTGRALRPVTVLVAGALGGFFLGWARLRGGKPIHTRGEVLAARIRRYGATTGRGTPWLDGPGEETGVARLSRALGLPRPVPDVLGLAVTFPGPDGRRCDLLLSTTGLGRGTRHLMWPRRDFGRAAYTTLLPYVTGTGRSVLLAAVPDGRPSGRSLRFDLAVAEPGTDWERFGELELTGTGPGPEPDRPVSFDPVLHPLPGLRLPAPVARVRAAAYLGARRGRHADPAELTTVSPGTGADEPVDKRTVLRE